MSDNANKANDANNTTRGGKETIAVRATAEMVREIAAIHAMLAGRMGEEDPRNFPDSVTIRAILKRGIQAFRAELAAQAPAPAVAPAPPAPRAGKAVKSAGKAPARVRAPRAGKVAKRAPDASAEATPVAPAEATPGAMGVIAKTMFPNPPEWKNDGKGGAK